MQNKNVQHLRETTSFCLFCFLTLENPFHVSEMKKFADREAKKTDHFLRHLTWIRREDKKKRDPGRPLAQLAKHFAQGSESSEEIGIFQMWTEFLSLFKRSIVRSK